MTSTDTQVRHDVAANLIAYARQIDPGVGDKRGHWIAYGIRHALIELGLHPDERTSCAYPDGDGCDPMLCPPECFEAGRDV